MWVWLILCNAHRLQCEGCLTSRGMGLWRHCGRALTGPRVPPCRRKIGQKTVSDKWRSSLSGSFPDCPYGHCKLIRNEYQYWKIPSCQSLREWHSGTNKTDMCWSINAGWIDYICGALKVSTFLIIYEKGHESLSQFSRTTNVPQGTLLCSI